MSENYVLHFNFDLAPSSQMGVVQSIEALSRGDEPDPGMLKSFRLGRYLSRALMTGSRDAIGTASVIWKTGIVDNPNNPNSVPSPQHGVSFSVVMHDDFKNNGGFALPYAVFDLVGNHGIFGFEFDETNRSSLLLYFKEFDDLIIQEIALPSMAYPLPPGVAKTPSDCLLSWQPASAQGFAFGTFKRLNAASRNSILAEADEIEGLE